MKRIECPHCHKLLATQNGNGFIVAEGKLKEGGRMRAGSASGKLSIWCYGDNCNFSGTWVNEDGWVITHS